MRAPRVRVGLPAYRARPPVPRPDDVSVMVAQAPAPQRQGTQQLVLSLTLPPCEYLRHYQSQRAARMHPNSSAVVQELQHKFDQRLRERACQYLGLLMQRKYKLPVQLFVYVLQFAGDTIRVTAEGRAGRRRANDDLVADQQRGSRGR